MDQGLVYVGLVCTYFILKKARSSGFSPGPQAAEKVPSPVTVIATQFLAGWASDIYIQTLLVVCYD